MWSKRCDFCLVMVSNKDVRFSSILGEERSISCPVIWAVWEGNEECSFARADWMRVRFEEAIVRVMVESVARTRLAIAKPIPDVPPRIRT